MIESTSLNLEHGLWMQQVAQLPRGARSGLCALGLHDEFVYATHPNKPEGTIIHVDYVDQKVLVSWNDPTMIPVVQEFDISVLTNGCFRERNWAQASLFDWEQQDAALPAGHGHSACECGVTKTMGREDQVMFHSRWCPVFVRGNI